jgi:hypothetical protein
MDEIIKDVHERSGNWPRRIDTLLFVDDPINGLCYFDKRTAAGLFGWLRRHNQVRWKGGGRFVRESELFAELERTAHKYVAVESLPHEPTIPDIYYRHAEVTPGNGKHLQALVKQFRPETTIDHDLIKAAFLTVFWGGPPGRRPAFVITSDDGRGVGKSTLAEMISYLCGGHISISPDDKMSEIKQRLLTPKFRDKRIVFLDNVKSLRLSWPDLESLVTESVISGKQMYEGESQRPNLLTWFITLNGVSLATDMAQRSVIIKLVKGENDGNWLETTTKYIDHFREQIIGDIIGLLRKPAASTRITMAFAKLQAQNLQLHLGGRYLDAVGDGVQTRILSPSEIVLMMDQSVPAIPESGVSDAHQSPQEFNVSEAEVITCEKSEPPSLAPLLPSRGVFGAGVFDPPVQS